VPNYAGDARRILFRDLACQAAIRKNNKRGSFGRAIPRDFIIAGSEAGKCSAHVRRIGLIVALTSQ